MKRLPFGSFRLRLIILVLIAIIPALGITLYSSLERREHERQEVLDNALKLAQDISKDHDHLIQNARQILFALSETSEVQQQDKAACSKIFADIVKQSEGYTALVAAKPNGDLFASSIPITRPINYSDRPWFQRLLKTRDFVIGEYLIGRVTGKPMIVLAHPVFDDTGNLKAILGWGMDLEWLNKTIVKSKLPEGTSVTVIDNDGTVLFRHPDPEKFVGKFMPEASIVKAMLAKRKGVEETVGIDGAPHLFGFTSLGKGVESVHVSVGIPRQIALAEVNRVMKQYLVYLGLIALLALAVAWFMGGFIVIHPVNRLLDTTKQLANGDLTVRTGPPYGQGEIGQLAWAFDHMATSLEQREAERRRVENKVILAKARLEHLLISSTGIIYSSETTGDYAATFVSENVRTLFGYEPREFLDDPAFWADHIHPEDRPRVFAGLARLFEHGHQRHEYRFRLKDGTYRWMCDELILVRDPEGRPMETVGHMIDITERKRAEEDLKESEETFREMSASAQDAIIMMDHEGNISFWNEAAEKIFGYSIQEALGKECHIFLAPQRYHAAYKEGFTKFKITGQGPVIGKTLELEAVRKDGMEFPIELSVSATKIKGKWHGIGIIRDITERKRMEEEREKLIRELQKTLSEVKTLKGIFPICASCKKIRDDKGYWNQVEVYIRDHSEAEFSHGICPECMKKLYPEF